MTSSHEVAAPERASRSLWRLELPSDTLPPHAGTNLYLVADGGVGALVDPGFRPDDEAAREAVRALLREAGVRLVKALLLTHTHGDHSAAAGALQAELDAPILVHPVELPRLDDRARLGIGGEVRALAPGRALTVGDALIRAVDTPGHSPGHLAFWLPDDKAVLAGDLVAGRGSTWVGVPEGDVGDYLDSIDRVRALNLELLGPGHGPLRPDPYNVLNEARRHRLEREAQVLAALSETLDLAGLRERVYPDAPAGMREFVEGSLLAHLLKLMREMRVAHLGDGPQGPYRATGPKGGGGAAS